ncbi:MAG: hypothetical protein OEZ57_03590, partial [Nitrospirota bacterium]|nr:hypothetical protein [Nitrospirota bacterium]
VRRANRRTDASVLTETLPPHAKPHQGTGNVGGFPAQATSASHDQARLRSRSPWWPRGIHPTRGCTGHQALG